MKKKKKNKNKIEHIKNEEQKNKEINKKIEALNLLNNEINQNKQNLKKTKYPLPEISKYEFQLNNPVKYIEARKFIIDDDIKKNKIHQYVNSNNIIKKIIDEEQKEIKDKNTLRYTDIINNRKKDIYYSKLIENHKDDLIDKLEDSRDDNSFLKDKLITLDNDIYKNKTNGNENNKDNSDNTFFGDMKGSFEKEIQILDINNLSTKNQQSLNLRKKEIKFHNDDSKTDSDLNKIEKIDENKLNNNNNKVERVHIPLPNVKETQNDTNNQLEKNIIPFSAKPSSLSFNDFESGRRYVKKITLTNTSCRVNTFKLLPLPIEIASYFEVQYKLQGMMSAGMTCKIEIIFNCPNGFNENITNSSINFEAAYGGLFTIPISCCVKQCIPKIISINGKALNKKSYNNSMSFYTSSDDQKKSHISNQQINDNEIEIHFGKCISGGFVNKVIEIGNVGAIETSYTIRPLENTEIYENNKLNNNFEKFNKTQSFQKNMLNLSKSDINLIGKDNTLIDNNSTSIMDSNKYTSIQQNMNENFNKEPLFTVTKNSEGHLIRNKNININIKYSPPYEPHPPSDSLINSVSLKSREDVKLFIIEFNNDNAKPIYIKCIGHALEVPIFIDNNVLDFKLCVAGSLYRNRVQIKNESNIALKFTVALANDKFYKSNGNLLDDIDINIFNNMGLNITDPSQFYIKALPSFIESFELSPQFAFAQPNEPFSIWFKIKIQKKISLKRDLIDKSFEIPVIITYIYGNVKCPLPVLLKGRITSVGIKVEPNGIIDFKNISICEKGYFPIKITNNSLLPQKLFFQSKNPVLSVLNPQNESIIKLKSREVIEVYLIFQPLETIKYNGDNMKIIGYTDHGLKFEILCIGNGIQSALRLSENYIRLSTTSIGKVNTTNIGLIHNDGNNWKNSDSIKAQSVYDYKFGMPVLFKAQEINLKEKTITDILIENKNRIYDCLRITPNEGSLKPLDYVFLEVSFFPSENDYNIEGGKTDEELKNIGTIYIDESNEKKNNMEKEGTPNVTSPPSNQVQGFNLKNIKNRKSPNKTANKDSISTIIIPEISPIIKNLDFIIPCKIRQHKNFNFDLSKLKIPFGMKTDINEKEYQQNDSFVIHLLVSTSISQPDLVKDHKETGIFFGNVLLNSESIYDILIKNESNEPKKVNMKCLNPVGPFDLVCYLREIAPKSTSIAKILFRPTRPILYREVCEFYTETSFIQFELSGTGIEPKVAIEPKNIEFNDVMLGEIGTQTLTINNQTTIPIKYKVHDKDGSNEKIISNGTSNVNFISAFHLNSYEGEVASMDKVDITIKFAPDHESDNYYDFFYIEIIGIKEYQKIRVNGRCWQNSLYISGFDHHPDTYIEDPVIPPLEVFVNYSNISNNQSKVENVSEDESKKSSKKKDKKSESNSNETNDVIPLSLISTFIHPRYKTMKFVWKISKSLSQKYNQTVYVLYTKDFNIVNGKVPSFVKTENKKIIPSEFNIEPYNNTFYINSYGSVTLIPMNEVDNDSRRKFIIEPNCGTSENVGVKKITVKILDPILNFWSNYFKEGIDLSNNINQNIISNPDFKFLTDDYQNLINNSHNNSVLTNDNNNSIGNMKSNQEDNKKEEENQINNDESNVNNLNNVLINTSIQQNTTEIVSSKPHSTSKGNQNNNTPVITLKTFNPEPIETCYKVILRGGVIWDIAPTYNCRDPAKEPVEGYCNSYSRIWIIKFITELPENPEIVD
ncbi:hypothetical protein PIROE2DRAFT_5622 [Piromyces sp. E2]|nr:hypothetical protein PIROE2DRAFT_5622 [Piromyces sp. E2]|eukprot:OUM67016.1 hypothetical protein PIROE2DRAFT_5622 [Piromyces sp. E2]